MTNFFAGVGCVISTSWLDYGGDPDHHTSMGIFKRNFYHCEIEAILQILLINQNVVHEL